MTLLGATPRYVTLRRVPAPGEVGCVGTCPLCSGARSAPPCLACRDELRSRLAEFQMASYVETALN